MPGVRVYRQKEVFDRVRERSRTTEWAEPFRELGRFSYERSLTLRHAPRAVKLLMRLSPNRLEALTTCIIAHQRWLALTSADSVKTP